MYNFSEIWNIWAEKKAWLKPSENLPAASGSAEIFAEEGKNILKNIEEKREGRLG